MAVKKRVGDNLGLYLLLGALVLVVLFYQPGALLSPDCAEGQVLNDAGVCEDEWMSGDAFLYDEDGNLVIDIPEEFESFTDPRDPDAFNFGSESKDFDFPEFPVEWDYQEDFYNACVAGDVPDMEERCGDIAPIEIIPQCNPSPAVPVAKIYSKEITLNGGNAFPDSRKRATIAAAVADLQGEANRDRTNMITDFDCEGSPAESDITCEVFDGRINYRVGLETSTPQSNTCTNPGPSTASNPMHYETTFSSSIADDGACQVALEGLGNNWVETGPPSTFSCPSGCDPAGSYALDVTQNADGCTGYATNDVYCGPRGGRFSGKVKIDLFAFFTHDCRRTE
ncbi:MAG: hypothetical protein AABW82_04655 [Nanoarchaeota archaeon]